MAKHTRARRVIPDDEDVELKTEEPQDVPDDMPSDKLVHLSDEDRDADSGHEDADDLASGDEEQPADDFAGLPPLPPDDDDDFDEDGALAEQKEARENRKRQREEAPEKKRRGRKKMVPATADMPYLDDEGNPLKVERDEIVMEDEDPKALEKVDENGRLKGGREYRNRVFTVLNLGDQLFMLSTEPARLVGFRDSYLLFKTHANTLYKKICTNEEKQDLIERGLLPNSYKGRAVNLVTARAEEFSRGGILADSMGMGKTCMMASLLHQNRGEDEAVSASPVKEEPSDTKRRKFVQVTLSNQWRATANTPKPIRKPPRATLVVCPVSLASQWQEELTKMSAKGSMASALWYGNDRADIGQLLAAEGKKKIDVVITSYGTLVSEYARWQKNKDKPSYDHSSIYDREIVELIVGANKQTSSCVSCSTKPTTSRTAQLKSPRLVTSSRAAVAGL